jgi:hypothetical protein
MKFKDEPAPNETPTYQLWVCGLTAQELAVLATDLVALERFARSTATWHAWPDEEESPDATNRRH